MFASTGLRFARRQTVVQPHARPLGIVDQGGKACSQNKEPWSRMAARSAATTLPLAKRHRSFRMLILRQSQSTEAAPFIAL
jgi:hypothetical protein